MAMGNVPVNDYTVQIRSLNENRCLTFTGQGQQLSIADCNRSDSQRWIIVNTNWPNANYKILNKDRTLAFHTDPNVNLHNHVLVNTIENSPAQSWRINELPNGHVTFSVGFSAKCLDRLGRDLKSGMYICDMNNGNQVFALEHI